MTRRRKRSKHAELGGMVVVGAVVYGLFHDNYPTVAWIIFGITALLLWFCFAMPTWCDFPTDRGRPCSKPANGKLGGCVWHARRKRDAMFTAIGMINPGKRFRVTWSANDQPVTRQVPMPVDAPLPVPVTGQTKYDTAMLLLTVVSTTASVVALL
ncbi:MAG: hypothetical protein ACRDQ5_12775 [Sciscionella sp.]